MKFETVLDRFWSHVDTSGECWLWTAYTNPRNGYGQFRVGGEVRDKWKAVQAHVFSWEIANGPVPDGLKVLHSCDTPACVRPLHLFLGTQSDNMRDCVAKGRMFNPMLNGIKNYNALKTHCKNGHEFTAENTILYRRERRCRICKSEAARNFYRCA